MGLVWAAAAIVLCLVSYFSLTNSKNARPSRAEEAKSIKEAFKSINGQDVSTKTTMVDKDTRHLKISQLWIYPIKSLRGCQVSNAVLTRQGFYLDRSFMLLKDDEQWPPTLQNMHIASFPSMCLFHTSIKDNDTLTVTYRRPGATSDDKADILEIPLEPRSFEREQVSVVMHNSPTKAYDMGEKYSNWFSERFGFKVVFVYWGGNPRPVLGNLPGKPSNQGPKFSNALIKVLSTFPGIGPMLRNNDDPVIAFNDCAPYLVINEDSVADASNRLPSDVDMDLEKFRANIVVSGGTGAYSEDFWGELALGDAGLKITLTSNCGRCVSLNVDHKTGESGTGRDGQVLKLLSKDRRVDPGMKYSPIFGRYGFVARKDEGGILKVGDEVVVRKKNKERTRFYWPGISTT
ncbi:related to MOSC domain protein [Rhynchosporium agropyri]|uniref:Related to MOSC domain protein n=1 Tax=Rhynchosporium agropyri TaxID=914238 RepID=A0A1E1KEC5_9HELO|nr:related to MOSC domain protein [Rhynchosporium agropyri]